MSQDNEPKQNEPSFDFDFLSPNGSSDASAGSSAEPFANNEAPFDGQDAAGTPFSSDTPEIETPDAGTEVPVATESKKGKKKKKSKPERKKKEEKKPRDPNQQPADLGTVLSISLAIVLGVALLVWNVFVLSQPYKSAGVGLSSTIYYLVGVNIFGILAVCVPVLFYKNKKEINLFYALLGTSVITLLIGLILLLDMLYRYDFVIKP